MSPLNLSLLVVLIIVVGVVVIRSLLNMQGGDLKSRQMAIISGRSQGSSPSLSEGALRDKKRMDLARKLKESEKGDGQKQKKKANKASLRLRLVYAGLAQVTMFQFWLASAVSAALFFFLAALMNLPPAGQVFFIIIGFLGFPRFVLRFLAGRRQRKFLEEFPDALESMVRLLKAGMPVGEAISMIAREFGGPLGEEMSRVYDSQKIGVPLGEAVLESAERMPLPEMQMFATGIMIQQQTGSSLSDVLMNLSALIRARFKLKRKVQALSSEAKASAAIIGALPVVVSSGLYLINPDYIGLLFTTPTGKIMLSCAIGWMMVGVLMMRQMINFKV